METPPFEDVFPIEWEVSNVILVFTGVAGW